MSGEAPQYLFVSRSARFHLKDHEVKNLDWVLAAAAEPLLQAMRDLCNSWQVHRFQRIDTQIGENFFALARIDRQVWRAMVEFTRIHDVANGNSEWHIFDYAPGCLKVYTSHERDDLEAGYHLFLYPFNDGLHCGLGEDDILVGWEAPLSVERAKKMGTRAGWDAETAHDWLLRKFVPKVLDTDYRSCSRSWRHRWWLPLALRGRELRHAYQGGVACSAAVASMPSVSLPANDIRTLEASVSELQRFFHVPQIVESVPATHFYRVLKTAIRCLPLAQPLDECYIRDKLDLEDGLTVEQGIQRRINDQRATVSWFEMDLAFRALLAIVADAKHAEPGILMYAVQQLQPLWDIYQDHELLGHWRSI